MDLYEELRNQIEEKAAMASRGVESFREEMLGRLANAKDNEILNALKKIESRLSAVEERLEEKDKDGSL